MRINRISTISSPSRAEIYEKACTVACGVAVTATAVMEQGRWAPTPQAAIAFQLSQRVLVLAGELGPVDDAEYAERHIAAMAHAAHLIVQYAREDTEIGATMISRIIDMALVDIEIDTILTPVYDILVTTR